MVIILYTSASLYLYIINNIIVSFVMAWKCSLKFQPALIVIPIAVVHLPTSESKSGEAIASLVALSPMPLELGICMHYWNYKMLLDICNT